MDSDKKLALVVSLTVVGAIWLFFCAIWMPPVATVLIYSAIWLHISTDKIPEPVYLVLRYEFIVPLSSIVFGIYLGLQRFWEMHRIRKSHR